MIFTTSIPPEAACDTRRMRQLRAAIAVRLARGDTLDTLERELIVPSGLPEEQQSALWLYAWSHPDRRAATDQLAGVKPRLVRGALIRQVAIALATSWVLGRLANSEDASHRRGAADVS